MTPFIVVMILAVVCFVAAHTSVWIRNGRVLHLASGRPFAPRIPLTENEDAVDSGADDQMFAAIVLIAFVIGTLVLVFGGAEGLAGVAITMLLIFGAPFVVTAATMAMFNAMDCVDDFTRFSAKAMGFGTLFLVIGIALI